LNLGCGVDKNDLLKIRFLRFFEENNTSQLAKQLFFLTMTSSRRLVTGSWTLRNSFRIYSPALGTLQTSWDPPGSPERMEVPPQTIGVTSASPTMDPTPRRGGRAASAIRASFEVIVDGANRVAIRTATVETVSLRCKICRGRGGMKGSLRKSGHFMASRAQEHLLRH
jgi:hypothetical protein